MKIGKVIKMFDVVVDTSVVVKWFFEEENSVFEANEILACAVSGLIRLVQPELAKYEFGNVLVKKKPELIRAIATISQFYNANIEFVNENTEIANLTYKFARTLNITYYDASFLAIASLRNIPLVTANPKHQRQILGIKIIPLQNFRVSDFRDL